MKSKNKSNSHNTNVDNTSKTVVINVGSNMDGHYSNSQVGKQVDTSVTNNMNHGLNPNSMRNVVGVTTTEGADVQYDATEGLFHEVEKVIAEIKNTYKYGEMNLPDNIQRIIANTTEIFKKEGGKLLHNKDIKPILDYRSEKVAQHGHKVNDLMIELETAIGNIKDHNHGTRESITDGYKKIIAAVKYMEHTVEDTGNEDKQTTMQEHLSQIGIFQKDKFVPSGSVNHMYNDPTPDHQNHNEHRDAQKEMQKIEKRIGPSALFQSGDATEINPRTVVHKARKSLGVVQNIYNFGLNYDINDQTDVEVKFFKPGDIFDSDVMESASVHAANETNIATWMKANDTSRFMFPRGQIVNGDNIDEIMPAGVTMQVGALAYSVSQPLIERDASVSMTVTGDYHFSVDKTNVDDHHNLGVKAMIMTIRNGEYIFNDITAIDNWAHDRHFYETYRGKDYSTPVALQADAAPSDLIANCTTTEILDGSDPIDPEVATVVRENKKFRLKSKSLKHHGGKHLKNTAFCTSGCWTSTVELRGTEQFKINELPFVSETSKNFPDKWVNAIIVMIRPPWTGAHNKAFLREDFGSREVSVSFSEPQYGLTICNEEIKQSPVDYMGALPTGAVSDCPADMNNVVRKVVSGGVHLISEGFRKWSRGARVEVLNRMHPHSHQNDDEDEELQDAIEHGDVEQHLDLYHDASDTLLGNLFAESPPQDGDEVVSNTLSYQTFTTRGAVKPFGIMSFFSKSKKKAIAAANYVNTHPTLKNLGNQALSFAKTNYNNSAAKSKIDDIVNTGRSKNSWFQKVLSYMMRLRKSKLAKV